jgi:hypothetical protein
MSKERLQAAYNYISEGKYDDARAILMEMGDDSIAQSWLKKIDTKTVTVQHPRFEWFRVLSVLGIVASIALIVVSVYVISQVMSDRAEEMIELFDEEEQFLEQDRLTNELLIYCSPLVSYGAETCLDWVDSLLGMPFATEPGPYYAVVRDCLGSGRLETPEDFEAFGACLDTADVPPPGTY